MKDDFVVLVVDDEHIARVPPFPAARQELVEPQAPRQEGKGRSADVIADAPQIKDAIFDPAGLILSQNHHDPHTRRQRSRRHANLPAGHSCNPTSQYGSICSGCWLPATDYWLLTTDF